MQRENEKIKHRSLFEPVEYTPYYALKEELWDI